MIISPLQNTAEFRFFDWRNKKPRISQKFGKNKQMYAQFGMNGHNGIDYGVPIGTPIFSPIEGEAQVVFSSSGYGKHVRIRSEVKGKEIVIGHFSEIFIKDGDTIGLGDKIGLSGNTGYSTGPHVHIGLRLLDGVGKAPIWKRGIKDYGNGFYGYIDPLPYMINWKGTHMQNTL